jgi:enediyne biosynthesis protein E4
VQLSGLVTDAEWTDYDNDGWEDLIITREWNSVIVLKNMSGKELVEQNIPEFGNYRGIWYGVTAGDFDRDGDDDYIVGNLGNNHRFNVSNKYPLTLYAIDLELDGILDPIITGYWEDKNNRMEEYPVNYLDELREESSFFQMRFSDYTTFSFTGFKEMLSEKQLKRTEFKFNVNTTSSYVIWNDKGRFRFEKLPDICQLSPIKRMLVKDFNGDSYPDVLITGNDYTYDVSTGYYDAFKGILLISKGVSCSFDAIPPSKSGFMVQGMVESLVCFEGDTSLIVAGINRDRVRVLKHVMK